MKAEGSVGFRTFDLSSLVLLFCHLLPVVPPVPEVVGSALQLWFASASPADLLNMNLEVRQVPNPEDFQTVNSTLDTRVVWLQIPRAEGRNLRRSRETFSSVRENLFQQSSTRQIREVQWKSVLLPHKKATQCLCSDLSELTGTMLILKCPEKVADPSAQNG